MPRIDPQQLLSCLSVLLSSQGGILSSTEVNRLANLMTKFSKKLVSKCVYVLILKNTETNLLGSFMAEGGWNLVHVWLQDAYVNKNWPLVKELLLLLLITPADVERLKMNNLPKVVKGLSRRDDLPEIQRLSNDLVQLWLKIVKDETKPVPTPEITNHIEIKPEEPVIVQPIEPTEEKVEEPEEETVAPVVENTSSATTIDANDEMKENIESMPAQNQESDEVDHAVAIPTEVLTEVTKSDNVDKEKDVDNDKKKEKERKSSRHKSSSSKSSSSRDKDRDKDRDKKSSSSRDKDRHRDKEKSSSSSRDKDKDKSKSKDRHKHNGSSSKSSSSSSSSKSSRDKDKDRRDHKERQAEKDKDTLNKIQPQSIGKLGRIPKKSEDDAKKDVKKPSMSIEVRKAAEERPKTVKVFNAKMRSTGLLEEAKPPPPRSAVTKKPAPALPANIPVKRSSPIREPIPLPEKKAKLDTPERPGAIKLIPPKPKPILQESDIFMDALNSAATASKKDTKKRKRRPSVNKEPTTPTETKPNANSENSTPPASPDAQPANDASPLGLKNIAPFNFYQDTLNTQEEEAKEEEDNEKDERDEESSPKKVRTMSPTEEDEKVPVIEGETTKNIKGVLCHTKKKGPKRSIRWKEDSELVEVQYFELDETERVNVTRAFNDMARMDISGEREALQMCRKTVNEDLMDVQTMWRSLIEIEITPPIPDVVCRSLEKDIQFAREKNVLQALYFDKRMIPFCPAEADPENHQMTDPVIIPLEPTDETEQEEPKPVMAWPEPKGSPPPSAVAPMLHGMMPQQNMMGGFAPHIMNPGMPFHQQNMQNFPQGMNPNAPGGFPQAGVAPFANNANFMGQQNSIEWNMNMMHQSNDQMMQPNGNAPMFNQQDNFSNMNEHHGFNNSHFTGAPPPNQMFPNQGPPNNFMGRGGRGFRRGAGNNWMRMNGPGNWNNNRGGGMSGGPGPNRNTRICKNIKNHGYCRNRDNCPFYHPNV